MYRKSTVNIELNFIVKLQQQHVNKMEMPFCNFKTTITLFRYAKLAANF